VWGWGGVGKPPLSLLKDQMLASEEGVEIIGETRRELLFSGHFLIGSMEEAVEQRARAREGNSRMIW